MERDGRGPDNGRGREPDTHTERKETGACLPHGEGGDISPITWPIRNTYLTPIHLVGQLEGIMHAWLRHDIQSTGQV